MGPRFLPHDWFAQPLPNNVELGKRCWLYSVYAFIHYRSKLECGLRIGNDTGVYNGTFFDLGPQGFVDIGDFCTIVGVIFCSNRNILISDYALLAHEVVIADHAAAVPDETPARPGRQRSSNGVVVGENAWIGARAVLLAGARIGKCAIVGAGTVVDFEVPPYAVVAGSPPRVVGSTGPHGNRR